MNAVNVGGRQLGRKNESVITLRVSSPAERGSRVLIIDGRVIDALGIVAARDRIDEILAMIQRLQLSGWWSRAVKDWRCRSEEHVVLVAPSAESMFYGRPRCAFVADPRKLGVEMNKLSMAVGGMFSWHLLVSDDAIVQGSVNGAWLAEAYLSGRG